MFHSMAAFRLCQVEFQIRNVEATFGEDGSPLDQEQELCEAFDYKMDVRTISRTNMRGQGLGGKIRN